ncbi:MAG: serine/threonine protein kinase [Blautia sp.]|nr:serine/threonine protein kinase [Blautia sp.]
MINIVWTGMILKGRYCILEQAGAGGEGSVFMARDLELGTVWAVKEIPLSQKREAKLMRLLEHPALPRMVDYAEKGDFCYLVMEYIRGSSLQECIKDQMQFSLEQVLSFGSVIAEVLEYLHSQEPPVFYGDLKPENLMLSEHGKLYLVDLGSAVKMYGDRRQQLKGTFGYAAPEQYDGQMKKSGDVYALGKTLWELMGKKRGLYFARRPAVLLFLLRCCQKRPDWRYPDMKTVKEELQKLRTVGNTWRRWRILPFCFTGMMIAAMVYSSAERQPFLNAVNEVTKHFYETGFLSSAGGESMNRKEICEQTERQMQELLKRYSDAEEQKKLLLLLARTAEFGGNPEHAALYYEQLLLYEPGFRDGYGEYGCFLLRIGQQKESRQLWETYKEKEKEGILEMDSRGRIRIWEKELRERDDSQGSEKEEKESLPEPEV